MNHQTPEVTPPRLPYTKRLFLKNKRFDIPKLHSNERLNNLITPPPWGEKPKADVIQLNPFLCSGIYRSISNPCPPPHLASHPLPKLEVQVHSTEICWKKRQNPRHSLPPSAKCQPFTRFRVTSLINPARRDSLSPNQDCQLK